MSGMLQSVRARVAAVAVVTISLVIASQILPRTSMEDLLEGRAAQTQRQAAMAAADSLMVALGEQTGMEPVAQSTTVSCDEGQNNYKVRDGYRLSCTLSKAGFLAWNGDFSMKYGSLLNHASSVCRQRAWPRPPSSTTPTPVSGIERSSRVLFDCPNSFTAGFRPGTSTGLTVESVSDWLVCDGRTCRQVDPIDTNAAFASLARHRWLAAVVVTTEFYRDLP